MVARQNGSHLIWNDLRNLGAPTRLHVGPLRADPESIDRTGVEIGRGAATPRRDRRTESKISINFKPFLDEIVTVGSEDAVREMRRLASNHGIFVGPSSGAHLVAARELRDRHKAEHVVTFFCDEGEKYINDYWFINIF